MKKNRFKGFLTLLFLVVYMSFSNGIYAQQKSIEGKVTDTSGDPLPGVSVIVQGTTNGTVTNVDGEFKLDVPSEGLLVFSYIGMLTHRMEIGNQTTFNVTLKDDVVGLEEVVVVGYGTRMKEELTGAVSTVSAEQMEISTAPSVVSRLQGQVSGVTVTSANRPGGDATIRIRGLGTINDPNPLYIIDGVPAGPGNNISPSDVESISVLKDASSTAIYGARGANGVIIITTKRGKEGQPARINFSLKTGVTSATNQYDLLNTQEYGEALWLQSANSGIVYGDPKFGHPQYGNGPKPVIPNYILPAGASSVDESLYNYPNVTFYKANKEGTNWYDEIYQKGIIQEYDISLAGGGKGSTYAFSGNYYNEEGFIKESDFKRYTFRVNADSKVNSWFKAGESLQVVYIDELGRFSDNAEDSPISDAYRAQPIMPVYDIMGNFAGSKAPGMGNAENPVARIERSKYNNGKWVRILGNTYGEITFMKGLTLKSLFGFNFGQWNYKGYNFPNPEFSEPQLVNGMNADSNYELQWNWSNVLNYNTTFKDIHKLNVILGTEAIDNKYQSLNASRRNYFSEDPDYMQLDSGETNKENSGEAWEWSLFSMFGRVNYDLMGKYFLEGTVRRDGSSRFGANNRYGTFPAVSGAWAISQENFMDGTSHWLDLMKLRLGWGLSGNDLIGYYNSYSTYNTDSYRSSYAIDGSNTSATAGFKPYSNGNENVSWETTHTLNLGLDMNMLDNSLHFGIDIWQRNTSDMLYRLRVPQVAGIATPPFINIGEMQNKGFDFEMGYNNTALEGKFTYNINATISRYVNEITKLSDDAAEEIIGDEQRQKYYTRATVGTAFPEFYGFIVDGIVQTDAEAAAHPQYEGYNQPGHFKYRNVDLTPAMVDTNGDGIADTEMQVINDKDRTYIGSPHPDFTGGLNIDLGYGSFDLNMFFYGSYGNEMINYVSRWIDYGMFNGGLSKDALYKSWGSPYLANNADATLPKLDQSSYSQEPSTAFIEDGSFLRLKTLRLGYNLPKIFVQKAQIQNVRIYAQVTNVFTLTKYSGLDPELNSSGMNMGLDRGAWPTPRQIMFGVNIGL
jgi:TonB-linked SusC/RagA family outer membrane protein